MIAMKCHNQEALKGEGDQRPSGDGEAMGSLLIYAGCKVVQISICLRKIDSMILFFQIYIFEEPNFEGDFIEYTGPTIMPDPKYQFGVSHQSLVWLEKHQANKKNDDRKKERKKNNKCSSGLADRTTIRCFVLGPTSGPASRFFLK